MWILLAAFKSLSFTEPQSHRYSRIASDHLPWYTAPQQAHNLELGNHWSILDTIRPYQAALYSSCLTISPKFASLIAFASFLFFTMFLTRNDSVQITWFSFISFVVILCVKSTRQFAIFSWIFATMMRCLLKLLEPFVFLESLRCALASFFSYFVVYLGLLNTTPSEQTASDLIPTSTPTVLLAIETGCHWIVLIVWLSVDFSSWLRWFALYQHWI